MNDKINKKTGSIIGAIIGVIFMIVMICIDNSSSGIMIAVGGLLCFCIIGWICGNIIDKKKEKTSEEKSSEDENADEAKTVDNKDTGKKKESQTDKVPAKQEETQTDKESEKQEEAQVNKELDKKEKAEAEKESEKQEEPQAEKEPEKQEKLQGDKEPEKQKEAQADKESEKQEVPQAEKESEKQEEAQADKESQKQEEEQSDKEPEKQEEEHQDIEADKQEETQLDEKSDKPETEQTEDEEKAGQGGFFSRLVAGLTKTRNSLNDSFNNLFSGFSSIDDDFYDELEETLVMADLGLDTTETIIDNLKDIVKKNHIKEASECRELVINIIKEQMLVEDEAYDFEDQKSVMLIIGVNGVGKTTSIGKLAAQYKNRGKKVMMCAADTFRAAAIDQLKTWANRAGVEIIAQNEGADPAAVTFDAVKAANARNVDILLVDTAGRLHNKKNLMDELAKMKRIIEKECADAHLETLIVLDGSTGQNALEQARQFSNVTQIDGIILTKLDGTAKGGIAIAIQSELNVPVKYIGVGEQINDLQKFDPESYVNALFADMDTRSDIEILMPEE